MTTLDKTYDRKAIESRWYAKWETSGAFAPQGQGLPFCIMIPPPNVTGTLHMGHAFQDTIMDCQIRYHRMLGDNTLWQAGTDHAGIATQMVVERQLEAEGTTREALGRDAFIKRVWEWKHTSGSTISQQLRRLGASIDWSTERFTMDEGLSEAVTSLFVKLYEEGLIYRGKKLVNWDPKLQTAVSDLEVQTEAEPGSLYHLRYPLAEDPAQYIVVATTRPETLFGDVAVGVHPEDERYAHLVGKMVALPLTDRLIPIIADSFVVKEFGTGCVKITPAHDFRDFEVGKRHQLPLINVLTATAHLNQEVPPDFQGLSREAARKAAIDTLAAAGLVEKIEPYSVMTPRCERSGAIVEPFLTDQWFMHMKPLAGPAVEAVETKRIKFVPEEWENTYFNWLNNIEDWCLSRQLWWGHRIPAWYDDNNNFYVGHNISEVRTKYNLAENIPLRQDADVLDTWFSSALWPFSTLGWPGKTERLNTFYPTNVLVTGFDIIFFWVARMIMMGLKCMGEVPFHTVYVHGLVLDGEGQKMSKSKGNVLDPLDLIDGISLEALIAKRTQGLMQPKMAEKIAKATRAQFPEGIPSYGTDALRFTFLSQATLGRFVRFEMGRLEGYRNFCNKLWNASRFVVMQLEQDNFTNEPSLADEFIMHVLNELVTTTHQHLTHFRFDLYAQALYEFTWDTYCDWYLEMRKVVGGSKQALLTAHTILLRLLHPALPFITEALWETFGTFIGSTKMLINENYPKYTQEYANLPAYKAVTFAQKCVTTIRRLRSELLIPPKQVIKILVLPQNNESFTAFTASEPLWSALAKVASWQKTLDVGQAITAVVEGITLALPMAENVDIPELTKKLVTEKGKLGLEKNKIMQKLSNTDFLARAPEAVITENKARLGTLETQLEAIESQLVKLIDFK